MKLHVVSGLSGAGKSIALQVLEDLGYYCVDNLPLGLVAALARELDDGTSGGHERVAVGIDARNQNADFASFDALITDIEAGGVEVRVAFVEADDEVLLMRFSETRRKHPLTEGDVSLEEALRIERRLLAPVRERADVRVDTSNTSVHELRDLVRQRIDRRPSRALSLLFQSFGFKHGLPPDADLVFDLRCLPNPYWRPDLRRFTGRDVEVVRFLDAQPAVDEMFDSLIAFLERWVPAFEAENRAYLTVAVGCTGGYHRSVYMAERLAAHFRGQRDSVLVRHRDMPA